MAKLTTNPILSGYQSNDALKANFELIEDALENTLSRDGTSPNSMSADIDLNSNDLLNVANLAVTTQITYQGSAIEDLFQAGGDAATQAEAAQAAAEAAQSAAEAAQTGAETAETNAAASAAEAAAAASLIDSVIATSATPTENTGDGSTTVFTINEDPGSEDNLNVFIDGLKQPQTSFTVSGTTLTFGTAPPNGAFIETQAIISTDGTSQFITRNSAESLYFF